MSKFNTPDEFANVSIAVGGRAYSFVDGELEVEQEADAKRVRVFALENPHLGITEDGEAVEVKDETFGEAVAEPGPETGPTDPADAEDEPDEDESDREVEPATEGAEAEGEVVVTTDEPEAEAEVEAPKPARKRRSKE